MDDFVEAAANGDEKAVGKLLKKKKKVPDINGTADVTLADPIGRVNATAMFAAAAGGHVGVIGTLFGAGADPDVPCGADRETPLFAAAACEHGHVVDFLLQNAKADVNARNRDGATALFKSADSGSLKSVYSLFTFNADSTIANKDGVLPREAADAGGHAEVVAMIDLLGKKGGGKKKQAAPEAFGRFDDSSTASSSSSLPDDTSSTAGGSTRVRRVRRARKKLESSTLTGTTSSSSDGGEGARGSPSSQAGRRKVRIRRVVTLSTDTTSTGDSSTYSS